MLTAFIISERLLLSLILPLTLSPLGVQVQAGKCMRRGLPPLVHLGGGCRFLTGLSSAMLPLPLFFFLPALPAACLALSGRAAAAAAAAVGARQGWQGTAPPADCFLFCGTSTTAACMTEYADRQSQELPVKSHGFNALKHKPLQLTTKMEAVGVRSTHQSESRNAVLARTLQLL